MDTNLLPRLKHLPVPLETMEEWMIGAAVAVSGYALNYGAKAYNLLRPRPTAITETENNPANDMKSPKSLEKYPETLQQLLK